MLTPTEHQAVEAYLNTLLKQFPVPGAVVGVVKQGELALVQGYGVANLATGRPVTPDTVFRVASISKAVAAVGLMQLWERGLFQLDDPLSQHLTSLVIQPYSPAAPPLTIRHLLTHTSGLGEFAPWLSYLRPGAIGGVAWGNSLMPLPQFYGTRLRPDAPPGEKWAYSNPGYAVLGQLIADLSGRPFADYMRDHSFTPLGLTHTDFVRQPHLEPLLATGYRHTWGKIRPVWPDVNILTLADGALFSTGREFGQWVKDILHTKSLLKAETLDQMWQPHHRLHPRLPGMGLGFFYDEWGGQRLVSHDGLWLGFVTTMNLAPDSGWGVYIFTNGMNTATISIGRQLLRELVRLPAKGQLPAAVPARPETWPELCGNYGPLTGRNSNFRHWLSYGAKLTIYEEKGQLFLRSRWGLYKQGEPMTPAGEDLFLVKGQPFVVQRTPAGQISALLFDHFIFYRHQP